MKSLILSSAGLKNLIYSQNYEEDFTFAFGQQEIKMKNIYAEFISPYVSQVHQSDPTINCIYFPSKINSMTQPNPNFLQKVTEEVLQLFKSISEGNSIELNKSQCFQLQIISILLKNNELFSKLDDLFPKENENDEDKIIENLEFLSFLHENTNGREIFNQSKAIQYVATNLYSIDPKKIFDLPKTVFYSIIQNDELNVESEDSLLDLIDNFFIQQEQRNPQYNDDKNELTVFDFYDEVNFEFLSEEKFKEFIEKFDSNQMSTSLWNKLKKCFYVYKNSSLLSDEQGCGNHHYKQALKVRKFTYNGKSEDALNGIIRTLTNESGGNVNDKGVVIASASTYFDNDYSPKLAMDFDNKSNYFGSNDVENSWLQYDFKQRKVRPTHYTIRTKADGEGGNHLMSWVIEGSDDEKNWEKLDSRERENSLNGKSLIHNFDIQQLPNNNKAYQYLRIRQTSTNASGSNYMVVSALEFFGTLIE